MVYPVVDPLAQTLEEVLEHPLALVTQRGSVDDTRDLLGIYVPVLCGILQDIEEPLGLSPCRALVNYDVVKEAHYLAVVRGELGARTQLEPEGLVGLLGARGHVGVGAILLNAKGCVGVDPIPHTPGLY